MIFIQAGVVLSFLAVGLGAFGAHMLETKLDPSFLKTYTTAVHYQFIHALALIGFGLFQKIYNKVASWPGYTLLIGIVLFSGSLFLLILFHKNKLGLITPIGGILLLIGWIGFFIQTLKQKSS